MSKYIKSHSNYVLKSRHQSIKDGTIFERNITTIGGINDFPNGQMPIYKSGNFLVTVRGGGLETNQYNLDKWEENQTSGTVWNLESVSGITSQLHEDNDTKIVLKQDYYDLSDFAYYGSMTELFRTSVTDILSRFPGELYCTSDNAYYTVTSYEDGERINESVLLGGEEYTYVDNPFAIDIHSLKKPTDGKELKFFADGGYENYEVIYPNGTSKPITYWAVEPKEEPTEGFHKGDCVLSIKINEDVVVSGFIGDNCDIVYLVDGHKGTHIRPKKKFQDIFYNGCSNFQKLLMNKDTDYTAIFSVIRENDYGYYRELVSLKFPTSIGDYNIDASGYGFNDYTRQMVEIGEFYDERFSDNLWRSMTHEAIKNFDWTYTREFQEGDEEEYVLGGQRIQKALRIFAREFDEILSYINNIKNINRVTYDERSNIPDYFLTDIVENSGWNVKLVYPYSLTEYYYDEGKKQVECSAYTSGNSTECIGQLYNNEKINGKTYNIFREFTQDTSGSVVPYSSDMLGVMKNGYFLACKDCSDSISTTVSSDTYVYRLSSGETSWYDECTEKLKNRIKSYTNETVWTAQECNNEFLRVLKINSPYIWRNKGTLEGIEMILGMFGLKSKRWNTKKNGANAEYDFDVTEYTSFAHKVEEPWDAIHQNYRINWLNSTKLISYDNRFISNYDKYGYDLNKIPYQGLPVSYREEYINSTTTDCAYIKKDSLESQIQQMSGGTYEGSSSGNSFTREDGSSVVRRYLYPNFNNKEELDGNIYYQMDGGWLSKIIIQNDENQYNFQYDKDNNINFTNNVSSAETLYKETVRNIRRVENVGELLTLPLNQLHNGIICNVSKIEKNTAIIDGVAYPIEKEYMNDGSVSEYITFTKYEGFIKVGENKYFDSTMIVYDENNAIDFNPTNDYTEGDDVVDNKKLYRFGKNYDASEYTFKTTSAYTIGDVVTYGEGDDTVELYKFISSHTAGPWVSDEVEKTDLSVLISKGVVSEPCISYDILDRPNGSSIKAYIGNGIAFKCQEDMEGDYSIDSFINLNTIWNDSQYTNYFVLDDINYSSYVSSDSTSGWKRLQPTDSEYIKVNTIINDYKGNNPHNGNMVYDNGHEYFTYFKRLFKYAIDNDLFDSRCFDDYSQTLDDEIVYYGFSGLVENDETTLNYDSFISADTKIHYFGNYKTKNESNNIAQIWIYGEDTNRISGFSTVYSDEVSSESISGYILNASATTEGWLEDYNPYSGHTESNVDEVTNQIMNNKRLCITFNLHNIWYKKEGQEEIKYLDDIVMNYLTQMIPSTSILQVKYQSKT